jgi:hypothetical protein
MNKPAVSLTTLKASQFALRAKLASLGKASTNESMMLQAWYEDALSETDQVMARCAKELEKHQPSLFDDIIAAGIQHNNHYSDLYIPDNKQTRAILERHPDQKNVSAAFINQVEGGLWIDIPFAYDPFWVERSSPEKSDE